LFGLDCEHACRSEYHPIYAMAIEVDDRPDHNVWALFVRNWGDEGFCAQLNHELYLPDNRLRLTLPRVGARPTVVTQQTEFRSTVDGGIPFPDLAYDSNNQAVVLTFVLPEPRQRIVGEMLLQMNWPQGFGELPPTLVRGQEPAAAAIPAQITDAESYFETLAALKPPLGQQLRDTGVPIAAAAGQAPAGLRPTTATLSSFVKSPLTSGRPMQLLSVDSRKQSNDVARWQAICAAFPDRKQLPRYKGKDISEICDKVK
jgi:hypothetical protein